VFKFALDNLYRRLIHALVTYQKVLCAIVHEPHTV